MSEPRSEDDGELREWAPLSGFLKEVPLQARRGLFLENVILTCIDCVQDHFAVGTSIGVVYWYNRETNEVQRLRPEKNNVSITSVKAVSSVDYMVAAGDKSGTVTVFKVPKPTPDWLPDVYKQNVSRQVERYTVGGLHTSEVTALEWSVNGQKLFSGDSVGLVVYTEIDFYMNLSKACEILNEKYRIVQLSFNHNRQTLLVATEFRCILAHKEGNWRVVKVGQKERNSLCHLGAIFRPQPLQPLEPIVYSCRSGFRIWQADKEGTVQKTIIFKEALKRPHPKVRLLRPLPADNSLSISSQELGPLLVWRESLLVTYNQNSLLVLDPQRACVVASLTNLKNLHSVSVVNNEILFIEGLRNIIRLGYTPDTFSGKSKSGSVFSELHVAPMADTLLDITNRLKESANKIKPFLNSSAVQSTVNGHISDGEADLVTTADEAIELPPVMALSSEDIQELTVDLSSKVPDPRFQLLDQIGQQAFDDILFSTEKKVSKSQKHRSKRKHKMGDAKNSNSALSGDNMSDTMSVSTASVRSAASDCGLNDSDNDRPNSRNNNSNNSPETLQSVTTEPEITEVRAIASSSSEPTDNNLPLPLADGTGSCNVTDDSSDNLDSLPTPTSVILNDSHIPVDIQPDLRSPDTILREVQEKERLLAEALDLKEVLLSSDDDNEAEEEETELEVKKEDWLEETKRLIAEQAPLSFGPPSGSSTLPSLEPLLPTDRSAEYGRLAVAENSSDDEDDDDDDEEEGENKDQHLCNGVTSDYDCSSLTPLGPSSTAEWMETNVDGWKQYSCPETAQWLSVCSQFVCMGGPHLSLHSSPLGSPAPGLRWQKLDYEAVKLVLSPNGQLVWKLDFSGAYALIDTSTTGPYGDSWKLVAHNVESVALNDTEAWFVADRRVFYQSDLTRNSPTSHSKLVPLADMALKVCTSNKFVWLLTKDHEILYRSNVGSVNCPEGDKWKKVTTPNDINVADIALGPKKLGWIIDNSNQIYFSDYFTSNVPSWWQVLVSSYVYETPRRVRPDKFLGHNEKLMSIATSDSGIWITNKVEPFIHMNSTAVVGHQWSPVPLQDLSPLLVWRQVCAEGFYEGNRQLWLLSKSGDLFYAKPHIEKIKSVVLPCRSGEVVCLSAARHVLWLLTDRGDVFIRHGISDENPEGLKWRNLNLEQIEKRVHLRHITCGCDVVWACDTKGDVHMVVGSPHSIATNLFPPAWVQVEGKPNPNIIFTKVYVGPQTFMVWALDSRHNVYVREAIFPDFQLGLGWVLVRGIHAVHLSISDVAVWAISPEGSVYRRYGITQNNYIGDYWMQVPGSLAFLTVSLSEDLWGISQDSNQLLAHLQKVVTFGNEVIVNEDEEGWELVTEELEQLTN